MARRRTRREPGTIHHKAEKRPAAMPPTPHPQLNPDIETIIAGLDPSAQQAFRRRFSLEDGPELLAALRNRGLMEPKQKELTWFEKAFGILVVAVLGLWLLWLTWPVWLAPLSSVTAMIAIRRANRDTSSAPRSVLLVRAERICLVLTIVTGTVLAIHVIIIGYDSWTH